VAYEIVKKLECITNEMLDNVELVKLTIGEIYDSAYCNSTIHSESFGVYDDKGELYDFDKRYFKVFETDVRENTGWTIECKDCFKEIPINVLIENNYKCPRCGQEFKIKL
jgi:DNA-directed RNA polymerase subunit RPC12/RpoP